MSGKKAKRKAKIKTSNSTSSSHNKVTKTSRDTEVPASVDSKKIVPRAKNKTIGGLLDKLKSWR